ncbi:MAG: hypothetical protein ABSB97_07095 [Thermoplasmata archaeon]
MRYESGTADDGTAEVRAAFVPKADEIGWPTLFHSGLHFLVLYEVSYWTALTLGGKVWVSVGPATYSSDRLPRVGVSHIARARILRSEPTFLSIRATTEVVGGKPCGSLESTWRPARRAAIERAHIPIPDYLLSEIDP